MCVCIYIYIYIYIYKVKMKCSNYRPGVAQRVGRGLALLFHDRGARRGWAVSSTPRPNFTFGKDPVSIVQEAGWAPGPVWKGAENLVPIGIRSRAVQLVVSRYTDWATWPFFPMIYSLRKFLGDGIKKRSVLIQYCSGDKIEKNEMGEACSAYGRGERRVQGLGGETWGKETAWETQA